MGKQSKVSVIIALEGSEEQFKRTVESVMSQSYPEYELLVIGNDNLYDCASVLEKYDDRIPVIYIPLEETWKRSELINAAAEEASGEYLSFVICGDIWDRDKLQKQIELLNSDLSCRWCYCPALIHGMEKNEFPPQFWPEYKKNGYIFPDLIMDEYISWSTVAVKKDFFFEIGGLDNSIDVLCEYECLLRMSQKSNVLFYRAPLVEIYESDKKSDKVIAEQCFCLAEFATALSKYGLKEEKIQRVIDMAEVSGNMSVFWEYANILKEDPVYRSEIEHYYEIKNPTRHIKQVKEKNICNVSNCIGCCGCQAICPVNAITMKENAEGFLYPEVNFSLCIQCGKCVKHCPTQNELNPRINPDICYAVQMDDEDRKGSSSGGIFPALARYIVSIGGMVAGAVFDSDFGVKHILTNDNDEIEAMRSSKYVQSNLENTYLKIHETLEKGIPVLFSGCSCQIAGLRAFLPKEYSNLFTVDVVCHGVPSPKIFREYLTEKMAQNGAIDGISFRDKNKLGWNSGIYIKYSNGQEYVKNNQNIYMVGFLNDWYLRESCYECEFKGRKYSDLTIGDFWGIHAISEKMADGKGTSYLTINSSSGLKLFEAIKKDIHKIEAHSNESALKYNPSIRKSVIRKKIRSEILQDRFSGTLSQRIVKYYDSLKFDVALVLWWSPNYGNAMTNYALYKVLSREYTVLAIDNVSLCPTGRFARFASDNYQLSSDYFLPGQRRMIQNACDTFVVGSDQTWNVAFEQQFGLGKYYELDFVDDNKRKISYAASFGMRGAEPPREYAELFKQFNAISVREDFGVDTCMQRYGVNATCVLDPVFLLDKEEYSELIKKATIKEKEPFIMAYLLNPTEEKYAACKKIQEELGGIKIINVSENMQQTRDVFRHILRFENVKGNLEVEDWLYYMADCEFVITDSFHGTCFSVIFRKPLISFVNRQPDRFDVFKMFPDIYKRIVFPGHKMDYKEMLKDIDYPAVESKLNLEREKSLKWLSDAMKKH